MTVLRGIVAEAQTGRMLPIRGPKLRLNKVFPASVALASDEDTETSWYPEVLTLITEIAIVTQIPPTTTTGVNQRNG